MLVCERVVKETRRKEAGSPVQCKKTLKVKHCKCGLQWPGGLQHCGKPRGHHSVHNAGDCSYQIV